MKLKKAGYKVIIAGVFRVYKRAVWFTPDFKEVVKINDEIVYLEDLRGDKSYDVFYERALRRNNDWRHSRTGKLRKRNAWLLHLLFHTASDCGMVDEQEEINAELFLSDGRNVLSGSNASDSVYHRLWRYHGSTDV